MRDRLAPALTLRTPRARPTRAPRAVVLILVIVLALVVERGASAVSPLARQSGRVASPRESALIALERASRPVVPYVAVAGRTLTLVAELSSASIQAGRWKEGGNVMVRAIGANGEPLGSANGRLEPGSASVAVPLTVGAAWPSRLTLTMTGAGERAVEDWVKIEPPSAALVGDPIAYRSGSRMASRPVAAFEFPRNQRIRVEWPVLAHLDRHEVHLLDREGRSLPVELSLSADAQQKSLVLEMALSGLPRGDYLFELTASANGMVERRLLAIRMRP